MPRSPYRGVADRERRRNQSLLTPQERIALANAHKFAEEKRREREARRAFGIDTEEETER
jgi:hypothetical protein